MFIVYDKTGQNIRIELDKLEYNGSFMGESFVMFNFNSPVPVDFEIGDYLEYRGEKFVLNYTPSATKNCSSGKNGDSFVYTDVKFNSLADELTRCDFLDVVLADNHVHFTSLSKFSFYAATVKDLADRIQANLNRLYSGGEAWTVTVEEEVAVKDKSLSVDNINCWEALSLVNSDFDANFVISGRTIRIGTAGISVGKVFGYGKGNGLINIEQSTNNDSLIVTRLRAYGSNRNLPYRYYNNLKDSHGNSLIPESMYVNNLMLPGFAESGGDIYIDSPNISKIGIREKSVYFDGSGDLPEIYPSIEGMTAEELKEAGVVVNATGRIDEIVSAEQITDDGVIPEGKEELEKKTFTITLKDIGFNPVDDKHITTETPMISMKTGWCGGREFEITGCEKKGNNYILTCNREMDSSINKAFPNTPYQVSVNDQFVLVGIAMDDIYIKAAEQRLLTAAKDYLSSNDKSKYTYLPKIDNVFMARNPEIASTLKEGNVLDFKDVDLDIDASVIIQSLIITEGGAVPEYEITLFNDKILSGIDKIQNSINQIANNTGITVEQAKSFFATWVEAWRTRWFDQKLHTFDPVKFNSITSTEFESKVKGWLIDALGNAEFRDLLIHSFKSWNFAAGPLGAGVGMVNDDELQTDKLLVRKTMYVLEMMIQRMRFQGGIIVLSPATGFKIDSVEVFDTYYRVHCRPEDLNEFEVNDQARIQNFTGNNIKYLWSLVLAKGSDYVDISRVDKDGDGVPSVGDEIVQLGNRTNPERQDAVLLSAVNGEVGLFTYFGINSFDLSGKEGSWFGKHGGKKGAVIKGEVHITSGSSGLDQFTEYEDIDERIQNAQDSATSVQEVVNNLTSIIIPDLQGQIDGSIMSHEGTVPPTLTNKPAVDWTTEEEKNRHLGDYYDYFLTVDGEQVTERYKFSKLNGTYQWVRVADSGSALAASVAREALGLAGTKATITWGDTLPTVPYNINDVWIKTNGSMYICNHQRLEGETGSQSDWQLFNDTQLRLAQMAADNVISIEEKPALRDTWDQIKEEFKAYQAQATKYGVSITALQNAYNTLNTFLTNTVNISQDVDTTLSVAQKTEYNQDFANYYSERTAFANVIAQKVADESVGNLQIGMVNLLKGSNVELKIQGYALGDYYYDTTPEVGKTYTIVLCYTLGENNTYIGAYQDGGNYGTGGNFNKKGDKVITSHTFKFSCPNDPKFMRFFQFPNGTYGSKVHWAVLVEGNKGPNAWIPSLSEQGETAAKNEMNNLQIGGINLADYSGGDFLDVLGLYDSSYASKTKIEGKTCLQFNRNSANCRFAHVMVEDGEYTFSLWVKGSEEYDAQVNHYNGSNYGSTTVHVTTSWERKVITFTAKAGSDIIHFGTKNTIYITDWKYEKGNKATDWSPSIADQNRLSREIAKAEAELAETKANAYADGIVTEAEQNAINEAQARLDALKIGSVNLVSRKMMLDWNNKKDGIAVWGQDADGIYLSINPNALRTYIAEGTNAKDIFLGEGNYKSNTQYVFSIDWETATTEATNKVGLYLYAIYTDGTEEYLLRASNQQTSKTRTDYVTAKGKTIKKITSTYGYSINCLIYSLALYEGNKVLTEIPVATEDLQGQSNVNLVDGGKEVTVTAGASSTHVYKALVVPKLKPNTVYYLSFNANNLVGSPTVYSAILYRKDMSSSYFRWDSASGGIMITPNNFTETEAKLLLYAGVAGSTNGNSVKFSEVMLVEGFTPPSSYSPSPGDVAKDIKDVSDAVYNLSTTINGAFKDGIIDEAEAKAIASNISILNTEKADIDNAYTPLYNSPYLLSGSTAATNLSSAKTAYNTAHTALISEINKAIADGRATAEEKASVDAKFTDYNLALGTYKKRVEEANRAIQDRIKALAEQDATNKVDGIQIGGTNLFPISRLNTVGYRGSSSKEGSGPEIIFKCNNPSTWAILPVSIPTPVVPANTDFIISMDIRNTNGFGFEVTATSSTPTIFGKINFENTTSTWKRISQKYNSGSANNIGGINLWGVGDVRHIKIEIGNKATDWSPSPEDVDQAIQDAIAKTVDITSPSQVFKYGPGYTGTPTPSSIVLTATPRNFTPTSYQWQYLNGSTWTNISGATSSTYSIAPGNTTLFPSGTNVRTFRCICNGDEKLSDSFTIAKLADGATGADGKGVSSTVTTYQASTSGTTAPTGTWSSTIPAVPAGQFLWTRTVINYTSGSPSTMYSVSKIGADGTNGNAGNGVSSTVITYQASTSGTTAPTGTWSSSIPSVPAGQYLWTRTVINYTSGSPSTIYSVGKMGSTGAAGKDAYTILLGNESHAFAGSTAAALAGSTTCSVMAYKGATQVAATVGTISGLPTGMTASVASNGTTAPVITFTVTTSMKTASGTVNIPVTVDGKSFTKVFSYSIAFKGDTGSAGKGVKSTAIAYQASSSGTTTPTGTWSSSIPAVAAGQYLWTRTIITYTDDTTSTMYSVGRMGTNGTNGNAGNGVSSTTITYQASTSGTMAPTGTWSSSIPTVAAGQYLWTRTVISYTNGTSSTIYSVGKMGNTGAQGQPGESINGKMLYRDPEFKVGSNGSATYGAQNGGGTVLRYRVSKSKGQNVSNSFTPAVAAHVKENAAGSPYNSSDWCLYIRAYGGTSNSHLGGFGFGTTSRANAVFIVKVSAKIPVGYTLKNAHNAHGTGYKQEFLTPMVGTGKYETYIFKETCGNTGTFSTINYLYLTGPVKPGSDPLDPDNAPLEWFVDYATVYDQTSDGYADIEIVTKDSFAVQMGYTSFQNMIDQTVAKGGKLVVNGLLNAKLIDVDTLLVTQAFADKLWSNIIKANKVEANMLSVAGFTFQDHYIFGGKDFGLGPGVKITSIEGDLSFKAYKDDSNYISMFYNSASNWGIIGKVDGADLLKLGPESIISGWKMKTTGFEGGDFKYPTISGSAPNYSVSGGQGSKLFPDGGIMLIPTGTGILTPSSGLMQAGLIKAEGSNAYIMGLEIIAHNNSGYGSLASVTALKLSAKNDYSTPSKRPVALEVEAGDVNIGNGDLTLNGRFAGRLKFITLSGTSATIENDFTTGIISSVANSNMGVYIRLGKAGSIVEILNYTTTAVRLLRNDTGGLATVLRGQKTAKMYCNGETWLPVMVVDTYNT